MIKRIRSLLSFSAFAALVALAACDRSNEAKVAALDNQLAANAADPALTAALEDQIMVDPELAQQSGRNAVRPAPGPQTARYPAGASADAGCVQGLDYNAGWARRLPQPFAVYPGGRLTDAAGNERPGCKTRVVTYLVDAAPAEVLDWHQARVSRAGYNVERQRRDGDFVMGGVNPQGGAYYLIVSPKGRGSDVSLIAATG